MFDNQNTLLEELRRQDRDPDWRREKPLPSSIFDRLLASAEFKLWDEVARIEVYAIYAKLRIDPCAALQYFCELAILSQERRSWAKIEALKICLAWHNIREILISVPDVDVFYLRCKIALRKAIRRFPSDRIFNRCLALILRESDGPVVALEQLETALLNNAPVSDIYSNFVNRELINPKSSTFLRLIAHTPVFFQEKLSHEWFTIRLNVACLFSALLRMCQVPEWTKGIDRELLVEFSDFSDVLDQIIGFVSTQPSEKRPQILYRFCEVELFWVSRCEAAEEARIKFIDYILENVDRDTSEEGRRILLLTLFSCVPRTVSFWSDPLWRTKVAEKLVLYSHTLSEPSKSKISARFLFVLGDYDQAEKNYKEFARQSPTSKGPSTFININCMADASGSTIIPSIDDWPPMHFRQLQNNHRGSSPTIVISANDRYFYLYGERYARRVSSLNKEGHLHLHLFGDPSSIEDLLPKISMHLANFTLSLSWELPIIPEPYFYATGRFLRLAAWRNLFEHGLVVTDIDSLWGQKTPGPLSDFISTTLSGADVGLNLRAQVVEEPIRGSFLLGNRYPSPDPWDSVRAAKLVLSKNNASKDFANFLSVLACSQLKAARGKPAVSNWFIDQNILSAAYTFARRFKPHIKFADLSFDPSGEGLHWLSATENGLSHS